MPFDKEGAQLFNMLAFSSAKISTPNNLVWADWSDGSGFIQEHEHEQEQEQDQKEKGAATHNDKEN